MSLSYIPLELMFNSNNKIDELGIRFYQPKKKYDLELPKKIPKKGSLSIDQRDSEYLNLSKQKMPSPCDYEIERWPVLKNKSHK